MSQGASAAAIKSELAGSESLSGSTADLLMQKLNEMSSLISAQKSEIGSLRAEIRSIRSDERGLLDQALKKNGQQLTNTLKQDAKTKNDQLLANVSQTLSSKVEAAVKQVKRQLISIGF